MILFLSLFVLVDKKNKPNAMRGIEIASLKLLLRCPSLPRAFLGSALSLRR